MDKFKFSKKILLTITLTFVFLISGICLINADINKLFAEDIKAFTNFNNGNFTSTKDSKNPASPSNWTITKEIPSNVKAGIINLNTSVFEENKLDNYNLNFTPSTYSNITSTDSQVLMLNARTGQANIGYTSDSFTLSKNSYYSISVWALTQADSNTYGTIALSGNNSLEGKATSFHIATNNAWKQYEFFIKTNNINSLDNLKLELWLGNNTGSQLTGATGAIFFDNIEINELSSQTYQRLLTATKSTSTTALEINLQEANINIIQNASFENDTLTNWTATSNNSNIEDENNVNGVFYVDNNSLSYAKNILKIDEIPTNGNFYNNHKALLINNSATEQSIGYESDEFTLEENSIYKLSVYAKSNIKSGKAQIVLTEQPYNKADSNYSDFNNNLKTFTLDLGSSTNSLTNDWIEYNMYVSTRTFTPILKDDYKLNVKLGLWVGTKDNPALGYALFDNISITKITSTQLDSASSTNSTKVSFMEDNSALVKNGSFNYSNITSTETNLYSPKNWTLSTDLNDSFYQLNGVFNTNPNKFATLKSQISNLVTHSKLSSNSSMLINPIKNTKYPENNVLMIGNLKTNNQSYESDNFSLSNDSYYSITADVYTANLIDAKAGIQLISNDIVIGEIQDISTNSNWQTYKFLVKTSSNSQNVSIKLSLGNNASGTGLAFFDNVTATKIDEETYNSNKNTGIAETKKVNLKEEDFTNTSYNIDKTTGLYTPNNWSFYSTETNYEDLKYGVLDTTSNLNYSIPTNALSNNILLLESANADTFLRYQSKNTYKISSNSYYKVSVFIKTTNLSHSSTEKGNYGATFQLVGNNNSSKGFTGIDTNNEWKEYVIYINSTDEIDYSVLLGLGNTTDKVKGEVNFSSLTVTSIQAEDYSTAVKDLEKDNLDNIMAIGNTDVTTNDDSDNNSSSNNFNFDFALVSSIITAVAIIVALVGFGIRKIHFKKPVKIGKSDYDRTVILKKVQEREQKINDNNQKLEELRLELESIKLEIANAKALYKQEVESIEADYKQEINSLQSYSTQNQIVEVKQEIKEKLSQDEVDNIVNNNNIASTVKEKLSEEEFNDLLAQINNIKELNKQQLDKIENASKYKQDALTNRKNKKLERKLAYEERRKQLLDKYNLIEKQIEIIYQQELELIKEYKLYKKQIKIKKQEKKQEKK